MTSIPPPSAADPRLAAPKPHGPDPCPPAQCPPTQCAPTLCEAFAARPLDGAATGFVLANLPAGLILWAQDRLSRREAGAPYLPGIGRALLRVDVGRAADVLSAMEDALSSPALVAVVGEIHGNPKALSFTATRRLALRAEAVGMPCWLIRHAATPEASVARMRWRLSSLPSLPHPDDPAAPGAPRWLAELFRARDRAPGLWEARYDRAADRLDLVARPADGDLAEAAGATRRPLAG